MIQMQNATKDSGPQSSDYKKKHFFLLKFWLQKKNIFSFAMFLFAGLWAELTESLKKIDKKTYKFFFFSFCWFL